jgi:uncharacterized membrane protein
VDSTGRATGDAGSLPFVVYLAAGLGLTKAVYEGFLGFIGLAASKGVGNTLSTIAIIFAVAYAFASWLLLRRKHWARHVLGVLSLIGAVVAGVYVFVGPSDAVIPSIVACALNVLPLYLLYGARQAREYFS